MQTDHSLYRYLKAILKLLLLALFLYLFLLSIELMGSAMKGMGKGFAEGLLSTTANPFVSLVIGIFTTSLIQSSSTTTSIIVGLVAGGGLSVAGAIPMIMGANIGTSVTNTIVSLGHITRPKEFKRAFSAATIHDFFNLLAVIILFPLELLVHPIEKISVVLTNIFIGADGVKLLSPIKALTKPVVHYLKDIISSPSALLAIAFILIFVALTYLVKLMRSVMVGRIEVAIDRYIFKKASIAFVFGILFTILVQSSSVTTSLIVPLVGAGLLTVEKIFPYVLGANLGTTITAILASLITANPVAVTVALAHLTFNILGVIIIYPFLRKVPIKLSHRLGEVAIKSKKFAVLYIFGVFYLVPLLLIWILR
jgi:sodium-dependent phosphate cotransporter